MDSYIQNINFSLCFYFYPYFNVTLLKKVTGKKIEMRLIKLYIFISISISIFIKTMSADEVTQSNKHHF